MEIKMNIIYERVNGLIQASVAELPGAISLGATVEEARLNRDEAIEMVLEGNRLLAEEVERERRLPAKRSLSGPHEANRSSSASRTKRLRICARRKTTFALH